MSPITYYYDSLKKKPYPDFEKIQKRKTILSDSGTEDLSTSGLDYTFWYPVNNYIIHEVLLHYSDTTTRSYSINKIIGRGIISGLNDLLYISAEDCAIQPIILSQGFYTGDDLATELETQMNANTYFVDAGAAPFDVAYDNTTGLFTITANGSQTVQYFVINTTVPVNRNSTAAQVVGFNADSVMANSIVSDTVVAGLGDVIPIDAESPNTDTNTIINLDSLSPNFTVDQALNITISTVAVTVNYQISYEEIF